MLIGSLRPTPPITERHKVRPSLYHEFLLNHGHPHVSGYQLVRKNFRQMVEISKLWSPPMPTGVDMATAEKAVDMTVDLLSPYLGQARMLWMDEIRVPTNTSPGILGQYLGLVDKVDALKKYGFLVAEFLQYAHIDNFMPIFSEVQKVDELLPAEKLDRGSVRTFIVPDFIVWAASTMLFYDMDAYLKKSPYIGVGYNKFMGGFRDLIAYLTKGSLFSSEDLTKYDRSLVVLMALVVIAVRSRGFRDDFNWCADMVPYYVMLSFMNVRRLPNGYLVFKEDGISSGFPTTSTDGSICHIFADCYTWLREQLEPHLYAETVFPVFYSDDCIRAVVASDEGRRFLSAMRLRYAELGLAVKPFDVSNDLCGQVFLGCTFRLIDNRLVPVYEDSDKILSSLQQPKGKYDVEEEFGRALSLYQEAYWNVDVRKRCLEYLRWLKIPTSTHKAATGVIPSAAEIHRRWFGFE